VSEVSIRREDATLTVELNRPERSNSLTASVVEGILAAITGDEARGIRLAVFAGRGRNFSSGFDLSDIESASDADLLWRMVRIETLLQAVFHAPFLTLAMAQGKTVGAGADLFCACSIRVASPGATFRMPGWGFGVALGTRRLAYVVGKEAARNLLLDSKTFDAEHGAKVGFVQEIASADRWSKTVEQAKLRASYLSSDSASRLLSITRSDTRAADMATLVETAGRPGLRDRILKYRESALTAATRSKPT
jgi:enoyl-CoA hydratase/carnithine racemase